MSVVTETRPGPRLTQSGEPVVQLAGATKRYGELVALDAVDLEIRRGESVAVLGPNGAGKTTSISLMLGLRRPTSGSALLFGGAPDDPEVRARCGVMLQESGVPPLLSARELVALFRSHYAAPLAADAVLRLARLEGRADARANRLSGGEKQRLYYALAVCGDPEVLFLDEPTVGLDVQSRHAFLDDLRRFAAAGKTIVLTTHYLGEADELVDRVVVIDHGRVIADDAPARIKALVPGRRVSFRTDVPLHAAAFDGLPVRGLRVTADGVRLFSSEPAAVLARLFADGVVPRDLEVMGADLEEAFLVLVGERRDER